MKGEIFMKNTTHMVVILKNINSSMIAQAILILKDQADENETQVMQEAEKIVEKYMKNSVLPPLFQPKKTSKKWLAAIITVAVISLFAAVRFLL